MTIAARIARTRLALGAIASSAAVIWGLAAALGALVVLKAFVSVIAMPGAGTNAIRTIAAIVGVATATALMWRARFAWMLDRVALWIEERAPELRYSLVTAADARYAHTLAPVAAPLLARVDTAAFIRRAAVRSLGPALFALAAIVTLMEIAPGSWTEPARFGTGASGSASEAALLAGSKLTPLTARVIPPAYANLPAQMVDEPSTLSGLRGSRVVLEGPRSSRGVSGRLAYADGRSAALAVSGADNWTLAFVIADTVPAVLELADRGFRRAIVVNPLADAPPRVKLRLPARDTVLRTAAGTLQLSADVIDDIGIASAAFEYIISSGSEETFNFRQGTLGATAYAGERSNALSLSVPYSFFKLGEGDRLSVRAVAMDRNSLSGPGRGFSETRTIRIARKDEYDSLSVEAAAPSGDTAIMSLRMLIVETERLEKERPKLVRDVLVMRSRGLARQTDNVRAAVLPLEKEEATDAPEMAMDTEMSTHGVQVAAQVRAAINDLEDASRKLDVADPRSALPSLYSAYKALESFRKFKRYYLRGTTRPVIVDVQRVRLSGKTKGTATPMNPRPVVTSERDRMRAEYSAAIEQLRAAPGTAVVMLTVLRVESLRKFPALSAALEDALAAIGKGRDATASLLRARRLLEGAPATADSIPVWSGGI